LTPLPHGRITDRIAAVAQAFPDEGLEALRAGFDLSEHGWFSRVCLKDIGVTTLISPDVGAIDAARLVIASGDASVSQTKHAGVELDTAPSRLADWQQAAREAQLLA
jgi:hypothetical protein